MEALTDNFLFIVAPFFAAYVFYSFFTKRGKGRMMGGEIVDTATDDITQSSGLLTTKIRAHVIQSKSGLKHVGIEISENTKLGASMKPIKLSKQEVRTLVDMLNEVESKT